MYHILHNCELSIVLCLVQTKGQTDGYTQIGIFKFAISVQKQIDWYMTLASPLKKQQRRGKQYASQLTVLGVIIRLETRLMRSTAITSSFRHYPLYTLNSIFSLENQMIVILLLEGCFVQVLKDHFVWTIGRNGELMHEVCSRAEKPRACEQQDRKKSLNKTQEDKLE